MEIDDYDIHSDLVERFILNGDKTAFKKMLNMNINSNNNKLEKQKENLIKKQQFMKSIKSKSKKPSFYYNNFYLNHFSDNHKTFKPDEINNFKLDFHNILQDPEYKDKCMKGNNKWVNMRFQLMKANLAKRRGISIDQLKMPKIWSKKISTNKENALNNIENYGKFNSMNKKLNMKENNKNSYTMNKYTSKMPNISRRINEHFNKHYSQKISSTFNI